MRLQQVILFVLLGLSTSLKANDLRLQIGDQVLLADTTLQRWYVSIDTTAFSSTQKETLCEEVYAQYPEWQVVFTSLPLVEIIVADNEQISRFDNAHITFSIFDPKGRTNGKKEYSTSALTHWRGVTASTMEKKSYAIKLTDKDGASIDEKIMGIRSDDNWILDGMAADLGRMRNRLCFDLWNSASTLRDKDMIANGSHGYYVELLVNGEYKGVYCLSDKVNRKLLGLKKKKEENGKVTYRGLLYKCSRTGDSTAWMAMPEEDGEGNELTWGCWDLEYPSDSPSKEAWQPLRDLFAYTMTVDTLQYLDPALNDLQKWFYKENFFEYPLFVWATMLMDNAMHNTYISFTNISNEHRAWFTPWDLDGSFGRDGVSNDNSMFTANEGGSFQFVRPFRTLYDCKDSTLMSNMAQKWEVWRQSVFTIDSVCQRIDDFANQLIGSGAWKREVERWDSINVMYAGIGPLHLDEDLLNETSLMKEWYRRNWDNLNQRFLPYLPHPETGIQSIKKDERYREHYCFDLFGQKIHSPEPGTLFIKDNKSFIIAK